MYLAVEYSSEKTRYFLRQSYYDQQAACLRSRDLFDFGPEPGRFIAYPGGRSFYVSEEVDAALQKQGIEPDHDLLEDLLWPFLDPEIRHYVDRFRRPKRPYVHRPLSRQEEDLLRGLHPFDKRRLYFFRHGGIDLRRMWQVPVKMFRPLAGKSRDELEQFFLKLERDLAVTERKEYIYAVFDLQARFAESFARALPQGLDPEKLDQALLDELCSLHDDASFWLGFTRPGHLHPYLSRYIVFWFDSDFGPSSFMDDYIRAFMDSRRAFHWPKPKISEERSKEIFGTGLEELRRMSRRELTRFFREKAHEHHPDKGGEHDRFVELVALYRELLKEKKDKK